MALTAEHLSLSRRTLAPEIWVKGEIICKRYHFVQAQCWLTGGGRAEDGVSWSISTGLCSIYPRFTP